MAGALLKCEARRGRHSRREGRVHDSTTGNNGNSGHTAATSERFLSDTLADASPPPLAASRHQRAADRAKQENTLLIPLRCYTESSKQGRVSWPTTDFDTSARSNFCNRYIFLVTRAPFSKSFNLLAKRVRIFTESFSLFPVY